MDITDRQILAKFKSLLVKRIRVNRLIIFGSRARGDSEPDSDMDILVIVKERNMEWENAPQQYSLLAKVIQDEGVPV